jgi:hypothetical protein
VRKRANKAANPKPGSSANRSAGKSADSQPSSEELWACLCKNDLASIDDGLERAASAPDAIDTLLEECTVDEDGTLEKGGRFDGDYESEPFLNVVLLGLLSASGDRSKGQALRESVASIDMEVADVPRLDGFVSLKSLKLRDYSQPDAEFGGATDLSRFGAMPKLSIMHLSLPRIRSLNGVLAPKLDTLGLNSMADLRDLDGTEALAAMEFLEIIKCVGLRDLSALPRCQRLKEIDLYQCTGLSDVSSLGEIESLVRVDLTGCAGLDASLQQEWTRSDLRKALAKKPASAGGKTYTCEVFGSAVAVVVCGISKAQYEFWRGRDDLVMHANDSTNPSVPEEMWIGTGGFEGWAEDALGSAVGVLLGQGFARLEIRDAESGQTVFESDLDLKSLAKSGVGKNAIEMREKPSSADHGSEYAFRATETVDGATLMSGTISTATEFDPGQLAFRGVPVDKLGVLTSMWYGGDMVAEVDYGTTSWDPPECEVIKLPKRRSGRSPSSKKR